jgi:hypothetical protein
VDKGLLRSKLNQLEARLQALFEGSASSTPLDKHPGWASGLVTAMYAGLHTEADGGQLAPYLFTLVVSLEEAQEYGDNHPILIELASLIEQAGAEAGLNFCAKPRVKIEGNPAFSNGKYEILAEIGSQLLDETSAGVVSVVADNQAIPEAAFLIFDSVQIYPLTQAVINIGRRADNHLVLEDQRVSRTHAQLRAIKGRYVIFDLESSGGTFVNGSRTAQATLTPGDVISLAGVSLVYGQEAGFITGRHPGETQPIVPYPPRS